MAALFEPLTIRGVTVKNRIMMSPMCQYSAGPDARANDWHLVHLGARAVGGVGLVMVEATAVESRGRISESDLGLYDDGHVEPLARIVRFCHQQGAAIGIQIAHAGRKAWTPAKGHGPEQPVAPSPIPFDEGYAVPRELSRGEVGQVVEAFRRAAERALAAGFDVLEVHGAHGYLIHEFLSPLTNRRQDEYGGVLANRARFLRQVVRAVRSVWPEDRPLFLRVSSADYAPGGLEVGDLVEVARMAKEDGVDLVDCSSGGAVPVAPPAYPGYQVPFAERIRREAGVLTAAVGLISTPELAEEIVRNGRADLVALGRELLRHPYWPLDAARALGVDLEWPVQYRRAKR